MDVLFLGKVRFVKMSAFDCGLLFIFFILFFVGMFSTRTKLSKADSHYSCYFTAYNMLVVLVSLCTNTKLFFNVHALFLLLIPV